MGFKGVPALAFFRRVLCVLVVQVTGIPLAASPAAGEPILPPRKSALLVFVSYQGHQPPQLAASEARLSGSRLISAELRENGQSVLTYPELESIMRHWRIRSDRDLSFEFLHAIVAEHSVDRLVVVKLIAYHDRMLLLARQLDPNSGTLLSADVAEEMLSPDSWIDPESTLSDWERAVEQGCTKLSCLLDPPPLKTQAMRLVVMPTASVGVGPGPRDAATYCLLRSVLETGIWTLPDPSLAMNTLRREGHNPILLEPRARQLVATQFGVDALLIPRLVSFNIQPSGTADRFDDGDGPRNISFEPDTRIPIYLALRMVDCTSGNVIMGSAAYLEPEDQQGLFGILKEIRFARRLQKGTNRLMRSLAEMGGDS